MQQQESKLDQNDPFFALHGKIVPKNADSSRIFIH